MIQHWGGKQIETRRGSVKKSGPGSGGAGHSQCVSHRPACCARSTAAAPGKRIKLSGLWSVLPETQLQGRRLHVEYPQEVMSELHLVGSQRVEVAPPAGSTSVNSELSEMLRFDVLIINVLMCLLPMKSPFSVPVDLGT